MTGDFVRPEDGIEIVRHGDFAVLKPKGEPIDEAEIRRLMANQAGLTSMWPSDAFREYVRGGYGDQPQPVEPLTQQLVEPDRPLSQPEADGDA